MGNGEGRLDAKNKVQDDRVQEDKVQENRMKQ
jgi:hypothetical protein